MAMGVAALSAETSDIGDTLYGDSTILVKALGNLAILFASMFGIFFTQPGGVPKYVMFFIFAFWTGQVVKPYVLQLEDKDILKRTLLLTSGVFIGMMALGFYDSMNILGIGFYLFAGLLGLIVVQALILSLGTPEEKQKGIQWLNVFGVVLFSFYTAYDIQVLRVGAASCRVLQRSLKINPDYPRESLGLFLDFINLFVRLGGSDSS